MSTARGQVEIPRSIRHRYARAEADRKAWFDLRDSDMLGNQSYNASLDSLDETVWQVPERRLRRSRAPHEHACATSLRAPLPTRRTDRGKADIPDNCQP